VEAALDRLPGSSKNLSNTPQPLLRGFREPHLPPQVCLEQRHRLSGLFQRLLVAAASSAPDGVSSTDEGRLAYAMC